MYLKGIFNRETNICVKNAKKEKNKYCYWNSEWLKHLAPVPAFTESFRKELGGTQLYLTELLAKHLKIMRRFGYTGLQMWYIFHEGA